MRNVNCSDCEIALDGGVLWPLHSTDNTPLSSTMTFIHYRDMTHCSILCLHNMHCLTGMLGIGDILLVSSQRRVST